MLQRFVALRSPVVNDVSLAVNGLAALWSIRAIRWIVILILVIFRRWRHLLVYVGAILAVELLVFQTTLSLGRARPFGVTVLGPWTGFSMPSRPLAALAISLMGVLYTVLPHGRPRDLGKWIVAIVLGAVLVARLILAIEAPTSAIFGAVLGVAIGLGAFRLFVPNDVFPVTYKRGKAAHLDVGGSRGEAIRHAVADQLG